MTTQLPEPIATPMIYYVCDVCAMTAMCVHNNPSDLAWLDHMSLHAAQDAFRCYSWTVHQLPFDPTAACV
jgi:hypothetical protein